MEGPCADSEEKREPVGDIDTEVVESLETLDPKWPIREADMKEGARDAGGATDTPLISYAPKHFRPFRRQMDWGLSISFRCRKTKG